jgi:hypothetical protein
MEDCQFGECVAQSVIDAASTNDNNPNNGTNTGPGFHPDHLSSALSATALPPLLGSVVLALSIVAIFH